MEEDKRQSNSTLIDNKNGGVNSLNAMILIGDAIHNLMDGLAIGVAFTADILVGVSTCIAVMFHELPHELGDFAVLVNNGLSVKKALLCNFGTACMAFIGLYIGIAAGEGTAIHQWVFAVTAGMFIYVSLVDLVRIESTPNWIKSSNDQSFDDLIFTYNILNGYLDLYYMLLFFSSRTYCVMECI
ncbi:zinc transporter ZIP12-like [Anneissia japonica]|uniref:zinc transporter ZIP12-like n=1 Tax=Anneissia japonica TaxID=1529436 RepID=UPI0014255617|nr:zinc transporter ZIP12-like [Anneissia japonica]